MDLGVNGKLALVTGASQGMLRSVAQILAENGARVAVVARKPEKLKVAVEEMRAFGEVVGYAGDLSSADAVAEVVGAVVADHGEVDILVNGIAMSGGEDKAETVRRDRYGMQVSAVGGTMPVALAPDDASWGRHLDTTLLATVRTCRLVVPSMVARGGGAVVNVSALSSRFHRPNHLQYGAMELAKEYFTVALAKEVGPRGVRVNAVIPGWLRTPRLGAGQLCQRIHLLGQRIHLPGRRRSPVGP